MNVCKCVLGFTRKGMKSSQQLHLAPLKQETLFDEKAAQEKAKKESSHQSDFQVFDKKTNMATPKNEEKMKMFCFAQFCVNKKKSFSVLDIKNL